MSYHGRYTGGKPGKKKKKSSTLWIVLGTVVGVILVIGIGAVIYVNSMLGMIRHPVEESKDPSPDEIAALIGNMDDVTEPSAAPETIAETTVETTEETAPPDYSKTGKIINIMVVGQASRGGEESKLSDTMLLLTINRETNTMTMTSFLRDMYIKLPDTYRTCGKNRINCAYALGYAWKGETGAMRMLDDLILEQFGTTVDYNVEIDFEGFENIINALGGIDIEMNEDEANYMNNLDGSIGGFVVGQNHLDGTYALHFSRMRHATAADSDMNRTSRQRQVIGAVMDKCRSMTITDLHNLMVELLPLVLTDMPNDVILTYAAELLPTIGSMKLESMQIPADGTFHGEMKDIYGDGNLSGVLIPDVKANRELLMAVAEADTLETPEETE